MPGKRVGRNVQILTEEDISDIHGEFPWDVEATDLCRVLTDNRIDLIYRGRQWGWDDTEVRDELAALLGIEG